LPLLLFLLFLFTFSGAGQKKLTENPTSVALDVQCPSLNFRQLCWSWMLSERGKPKAQRELTELSK
jgi:hypothetical protein